MLDVLRSPYPVQAVRPMRHWWLCPRVLAWFRVLMIMSLAKPPASAGPLSRIGDYLFAARGPGLFLGIRRRTTTFPYESTVTRGPPYPLFHRRCGSPASSKVPSPSHAGLGNQWLLFQELEAQRPHGGQLPLKLPMGFRRGERLKQVWQLHPVAHDGIGRFVTQLFADKQTVFGVEEHAQRVSNAQEPVRQGLNNTQSEEGEEGYPLAWRVIRRREYSLQGHTVVHRLP